MFFGEPITYTEAEIKSIKKGMKQFMAFYKKRHPEPTIAEKLKDVNRIRAEHGMKPMSMKEYKKVSK